MSLAMSGRQERVDDSNVLFVDAIAYDANKNDEDVRERAESQLDAIITEIKGMHLSNRRIMLSMKWGAERQTSLWLTDSF